MVRRLYLFFMAVLLLFISVAPAFANSDATYRGYPAVKVIVNGQEVEGEVPAIIMDGRTLVPLRAISEALGADVQWDASTNTVHIVLFPTGTSPSQSLPSPGENVIRIGFIAPLTGDVSVFGESVMKAFNLAIEERNHQVNNYKIEAVITDDRNDAIEAVSMAERLITQDKVSAIVGSVTSKCTIPISQITQEHMIPVITPTATNPNVTVSMGQRKDYAFRACFIDPFQGTMAAKFALENLKLKTAAVLYDRGNPYTEGLASNFKETFEKGGGRVLTYETYAASDMDFSAVLARVAQQKPDILYLTDYYMKVSLIGKQAREKGIKATFMGGDGWDSMDIDFATMEGGYFTNHWSPGDPRPEVREWLSKYKAKYGTEPDVIATLAYDATKILLQAIETANSSDPTKIKEAMQNLKDFPAVSGKTTFDGDGNPVKSAVIMQIKGGRQIYVTTVAP